MPFRQDDLRKGLPEKANAPCGLAEQRLLVRSQGYRKECGLEAASVMLVSLRGPGDSFDLEASHVIPALIRKCVEARERGADAIEVWDCGKATRDSLCAEDTAREIAAALERLEGSEPALLGAGREIGIHDLATMIAKLCEFRGGLRLDAIKPDGQPRRGLDAARAREQLGCTARIVREERLARTIARYRSGRAAAEPGSAGRAGQPGPSRQPSSGRRATRPPRTGSLSSRTRHSATLPGWMKIASPVSNLRSCADVR